MSDAWQRDDAIANYGHAIGELRREHLARKEIIARCSARDHAEHIRSLAGWRYDLVPSLAQRAGVAGVLRIPTILPDSTRRERSEARAYDRILKRSIAARRHCPGWW